MKENMIRGVSKIGLGVTYHNNFTQANSNSPF